MIRWRNWSRLARRAALGIGVGAAALPGSGCQSPDPRPEPAARQAAYVYPGVLAPRSRLGEPVAAAPRAPTGVVPAVAKREPPTGVRPAVVTEKAGPAAPAAKGVVAAQAAIDPLPGGQPEETIDLGVALRLAGVDNPTINIAREQVREALAVQLGARALLLPSVNIGGNYHLHNGILQPSFGGTRKVNSQSLYLGFGARTLAAESVAFPGVRLFAHLGDAVFEPLAARQRVTARRSDARATENGVLLDVATAYLELVGAEARLEVLRRGEKDLAELTRLTEANAAAGQARPADARRAESNLDLLRSEIRRGEGDVAVASARLCRLLNLDPSVRVQTPGGPVEPFRIIAEDADTESLVASAVRARPELFARTAEIREAQARVRQERVRPFVPLLSVGMSGGFFGGGSNLVASQFSPLQGRSDFDVMAVWTGQNLGFGNVARVRQAGAVVGEAIAGYDVAMNRVRREVAEAVAAAKAAVKQLELAKKSVADAEEGLRLELDRIRGGFGRPLEALDSYRQLLESRQELLRAIVAFDIAQFRLFVAVGSSPLAGPPVSPVAEVPTQVKP